jgi:hypothetical protein
MSAGTLIKMIMSVYFECTQAIDSWCSMEQLGSLHEVETKTALSELSCG